jgi:hypothetical protein
VDDGIRGSLCPDKLRLAAFHQTGSFALSCGDLLLPPFQVRTNSLHSVFDIRLVGWLVGCVGLPDLRFLLQSHYHHLFVLYHP